MEIASLYHLVHLLIQSDDRRDDLPGHIADLAAGATDIRLVCRYTLDFDPHSFVAHFELF